MKSLKLYRGITVAENEVDVVIHDIKTNGLYQSEKQQWGGFIWKNIKGEIKKLYNKEFLTRDDTSPTSVWIGKKQKKYIKTGRKHLLQKTVAILNILKGKIVFVLQTKLEQNTMPLDTM